MKHEAYIPIILLSCFFFTKAVGQNSAPITVQQVLQLTDKNSPQLSASVLNELAASRAVDIARANYLPSLDVGAIDTTGFPASSSGLDVGGLMASPYRSGYGAGLVATQVIWDFGRTSHNVAAAKYQVQYQKADTKVTDYQIKELALSAYYECTDYNTQHFLWKKLARESEIITTQVIHFVNTGQVSIVDKYLAKSETEETQTAQAFFAKKELDARHGLAIIMGVKDSSFSCPRLPYNLIGLPGFNINMNNNPMIQRAMVQVDIEKERLKSIKANFYPKIVAEGSVGVMQNARLVEKQPYAIGVGVVIPLLDFTSSAEIKHDEVLISEKQQEVASEIREVAEMNASYDETIDSYTVRLTHLNKELNLANKAFLSAKKRYFSLEGDLIDLREAYRNLLRVESEIIDTRVQILQASGDKALLNGADLSSS